MQEIGKSYTSLKQAIYQAYLAKHKRSTLIFDTNNEYGIYEIDGVKHKIQTIGHNDIIKFGNAPVNEVRRIVPFHPGGFPMSPEEAEPLLIKVINNYRGGTLIIEDLNRIYADSLPKSISGLLCNVRHRNCDVVFHLQSISRLLPKMLQNAKIIRYHYQLDSIEASKEKLDDELEIFKLTEKLVNTEFNTGNRHFLAYIYREEKKIRGKFSPLMFTVAIQEYLSENMKIIKPLLDKRNAQGKKINTYEQAHRLKTEELFHRYYGN